MKPLSALALLALLPALTFAQPPAPAAPPVTIALTNRQSQTTPHRQGFTHTGGGNIDVAQPAPDTLVVTVTGVAVAGAHPVKHSAAALHFALDQDFEISFDDKAKLKQAKLT